MAAAPPVDLVLMVVLLAFLCQLGIAAKIYCIIHLSVFARSIRAATPCHKVALMAVGSAASAVKNHFLPLHPLILLHFTLPNHMEAMPSVNKLLQHVCFLLIFLSTATNYVNCTTSSQAERKQTGRMRATFFGEGF